MTGRIVYGSPRRYYLGDREVTRAEFDAAFPAKAVGGGPAVQGTTTWPLVSEALAVHPKQVAAANARNKRHGVGTRYRRDGMAVIPDNGDRRRLMKLEGVRDKRAFL